MACFQVARGNQIVSEGLSRCPGYTERLFMYLTALLFLVICGHWYSGISYYFERAILCLSFSGPVSKEQGHTAWPAHWRSWIWGLVITCSISGSIQNIYFLTGCTCRTEYGLGRSFYAVQICCGAARCSLSVTVSCHLPKEKSRSHISRLWRVAWKRERNHLRWSWAEWINQILQKQQKQPLLDIWFCWKPSRANTGTDITRSRSRRAIFNMCLARSLQIDCFNLMFLMECLDIRTPKMVFLNLGDVALGTWIQEFL